MTRRAPLAGRPARRVPSRAERRLAWGILALLPLVVIALFVQGAHFDPALFALDPAALEHAPRSAAMPAVAPRPTANPELPALTSARVKPASAGNIAGIVLPHRLDGVRWEADGAAEQFTPATLYQKIDGRADVYLKDGFARLDTISYTHGMSFIDVYLYDMGSEPHARSRFTAERANGAEAAPLGSTGYCVAASCFFVGGRYYAQVIGSDPGPETTRTVRDVAQAIATLTGQPRR